MNYNFNVLICFIKMNNYIESSILTSLYKINYYSHKLNILKYEEINKKTSIIKIEIIKRNNLNKYFIFLNF